MTRLDTYCKLLERIYGERIVKSFTTRNENYLKMNDEYNNQIEKKNYQRKENEGCTACKPIFRNPNFFKRNLEFPGWIENLDFSGTTPAKEIMIIGEAPTILEDQINIAFGLGFYPIDNSGNLNFDQLEEIYSGEKTQLKAILKSVRPNRFWEYLNLLFLNKLDVIKPKIYITDLCKCNDDIVVDGDNVKNKDIWGECRDKYLIEEIELINPNLIIFHSWSPYKYLIEYLLGKKIIDSEDEILEDVECYYSNNEDPDYSKTKLYYNPFFGKFPFYGNNIHFFVILHQSYFYRRLEENRRINYINRNHQFIEEKVLNEVL